MAPLYFAAVALLYALLYVQRGVAETIQFGIDHREHLIPHTHHNYSHYVSVHTLKTAKDLNQMLDLVTHADFKALKLLYKNADRQLPAYLHHNEETINLFESKANWKAWMTSIGLGEYVPYTYDINRIDLIKYPVVLKTDEHNGRGVYVAADRLQLHNMVSVISKKKDAYASNFTVEEALIGMGLSEVASFGAVYNGKVVSLRCVVRFFDHEKAANSAAHGHDKYHTDAVKNTSVFIKSKTLFHDHQEYIPCSRELVNVTQTMFSHRAPYTGAFCSNIKMDSHGRFKLMETNARFCFTMRSVEEIFLSTYIPLGFAVQEHLPVHARSAWVNESHLAQFYAQEQAALRTGGGIINGKLITVDRFNVSLRVDGPVYHPSTGLDAVPDA